MLYLLHGRVPVNQAKVAAFRAGLRTMRASADFGETDYMSATDMPANQIGYAFHCDCAAFTAAEIKNIATLAKSLGIKSHSLTMCGCL